MLLMIKVLYTVFEPPHCVQVILFIELDKTTKSITFFHHYVQTILLDFPESHYFIMIRHD